MRLRSRPDRCLHLHGASTNRFRGALAPRHWRVALTVGRVHLVYPHGDRISCPDAIGRHTAAGLRASGYQVVAHDWDETGVIRPDPGDVLIGHPHPAPWTIFRRSAQRPGWRRVLLLSP